MIAYENFIQWRNANSQDQSFSENVFMDYFKELNEKYKPSTLWCIYSMVKAIVFTKHGFDIKTYHNLSEFLRNRSRGFVGKKTKILSTKDVERFLKEAPDHVYLATKVALIFGVVGSCGSQDLRRITTKDIEQHGKMLLVKVTSAKNKIPRTFVIHGPFYDIVKKYEALRSPKATDTRFFQNFQKGRCTAQPIGVNKFGGMPKEIAKFLGLPDAEEYTGHGFRKTSARFLDSGADGFRKRQLKRMDSAYYENGQSNDSANIQSDHKKFCSEPSTSNGNNLLVPRTTEELQHPTTSFENNMSPSISLMAAQYDSDYFNNSY